MELDFTRANARSLADIRERMVNGRIFGLRRSRTLKRRTIVFGLKSSNCSREVLFRLLSSVVMAGDEVLAVHVQEDDLDDDDDDAFDLNTFHIHEDLCKSKQVDFHVKACVGESYISELTRQVRVSFATVLALGCSSSRPDDSIVVNFLKKLPPTCTLIVLDNGGRMLIQREGTSQQGSTTKVFQSTVSSSTTYKNLNRPGTTHHFQKSLTMPSPSTSTAWEAGSSRQKIAMKTMQCPDVMAQKLFQRLVLLEAKETSKRFTSSELKLATRDFSPEMVIGEGGHSKVYNAILGDGQPAAVKVLKITQLSAEDLLQEVEILSDINHENIVKIIGYCYNREMHAVVYDLLKGSLKQKLRQLKWKERMGVAIGVAKALAYLHHSCDPPIIHRDVKSSNILLSENCHPQLSDFGSAMVYNGAHQVSAKVKPLRVVGTFGYLAPEYMMYGKVDEKIDVYSYGVVLLELISGKEAIQTNQASNHESLVLWARSLLSSGLCDRLIDPNLNDDYDKEEMRTMVIAARLCLLHSSSRRPTMKMILLLFEEPERWLKMQREREKLLKGLSSKSETGQWRHEDLFTNDTLVPDNT